MAFNWTPARVEKLRELWPRISATEIAERFGVNCTRNGKAHRLHLPEKPRGATPAQARQSAQKRWANPANRAAAKRWPRKGNRWAGREATA